MTRQKRTHWIPYQTRPSGSSVPRSTRSFARSDPFARRRRRTPRATTRREIPRRVRTNKNVSIRFARGGRVEPTGMRAREASNAFERPAPPASRGGSESHRDYPWTPIRRVMIREKRRSNTALEVASPVWIDSTRTTRRTTRDATRRERRTLAGAGAAASADSPSARTRVDRRDACVGFATTETERAANMFVRRVMPTSGHETAIDRWKSRGFTFERRRIGKNEVQTFGFDR